MVLVLRVVTMFHECSTELAEAEGHDHAASAVVHAAYSVHILPAPFLPVRGNATISLENLTLFEVDVDVVAPAVSAILKMPDLQDPRFSEPHLSGGYLPEAYRRRPF